jgi:hypothetical protein
MRDGWLKRPSKLTALRIQEWGVSCEQPPRQSLHIQE